MGLWDRILLNQMSPVMYWPCIVYCWTHMIKQGRNPMTTCSCKLLQGFRSKIHQQYVAAGCHRRCTHISVITCYHSNWGPKLWNGPTWANPKPPKMAYLRYINYNTTLVTITLWHRSHFAFQPSSSSLSLSSFFGYWPHVTSGSFPSLKERFFTTEYRHLVKY